MGTKCNCCGTNIGAFDDFEHLSIGKERYLVCGKCSSKIHAYQKGNISLDDIVGPRCITPIADYLYGLSNVVEESDEQEKVVKNYEQQVQNVDSESTSSIGEAIKTLSAIILVLCVLGALVIMIGMDNLVLGLAILPVSVLSCLLSYGIGEIVCLLKSIDSKLK